MNSLTQSIALGFSVCHAPKGTPHCVPHAKGTSPALFADATASCYTRPHTTLQCSKQIVGIPVPLGESVIATYSRQGV
jgi:hypothetical protein